jgi:hypothetical protein
MIIGKSAIEQAREPAPLRSGDVARTRLGDTAAGFDLEAGGRDLLQLIVRGLTGRGHTEVGEGARHGRISFEKGGRN